MIHSQPLIPSKFGSQYQQIERGTARAYRPKLTVTIRWGAAATRNRSVWHVAQPRQKSNVC